MGKARVTGTTIEAIRAAEMALGRTLPSSFARWLLEHNGKALGALEVFPVFDARDPRKTWESIVRHFEGGWRAWQDNVCADPAVVLWSHETGATSVVADGYTAFLASTDRPG
ncbi:SMI1/KNR4 family protein [Pseudomonas sp. W17]|uniref:SMI1/KNR4 family protein n=1 Tax=Pseudomonas sp. W17 TaxID=3144407 RepID=A0AAU7X1B7_9PSED